MRWLISLEKAKALKEAGLKWNAKGGDFYFYANGEFTGEFIIKRDPGEPVETPMDCQVWLPRLDQLLTEIAKLGYRWRISLVDDGNCTIKLYPIWDYKQQYVYYTTGKTPDDAAADALLWVMK